MLSHLGDYSSMFNSVDLSDMKEVLLWRRYDISLKVFHYVVSYLQTVHPSGNGCGNTGFTRTLVESVLMKTGCLSMPPVPVIKAIRHWKM